ncbi:hypothetical protein MYX82_08990 [Acidobacteria bacterium AH-259-D05]|nr:hypothetical protein [Acidobacteria bacterium AH-259-D05]
MDGLRVDRIRLGHLLILALIIRLAFFCGGIRGADAYAYAEHAYNITQGQYDLTAENLFYGFRFAVLLPTALAYTLFGVNDWSSALFERVHIDRWPVRYYAS